MGRKLPTTDLSDNKNPSVTQKFIDLCNRIQKEKKLDLDEAFESAFDILTAEGVIGSDSSAKSWQSRKMKDRNEDSISDSFRRFSRKNNETNEISKVNLKDVFIDDK